MVYVRLPGTVLLTSQLDLSPFVPLASLPVCRLLCRSGSLLCSTGIIAVFGLFIMITLKCSRAVALAESTVPISATMI